MVCSLAHALWRKCTPVFYVNINRIFLPECFSFLFFSFQERGKAFIFLKICKFLRHSFLHTVVNPYGLLSFFSLK